MNIPNFNLSGSAIDENLSSARLLDRLGVSGVVRFAAASAISTRF